MSIQPDVILPLPVVPAASATVTVLDTTKIGASGACRATVGIFVDQPVTLFYAVKLAGGTIFRPVNNGGAGEVVAANTLFQRDFPLFGDAQQIYITAGGTPPGVWEVSCRLSAQRALAQ